MQSLLFVFVLFSAPWLSSSQPIHASCSCTWFWTVACQPINDAIVNQILMWKTADNCKNGGEKCLYTLVSNTTTEIKAKHTTPVHFYVDDLTLTFIPDGNTCKMKGFSSSEVWYAVLDYGTNFCNMRNLIDGAGLDKQPGFTETTSDTICTQYSSQDCEKY